MRFYVLVLTFFYSNLFAESYDKNTFNEYFATGTNVHGHIFTIKLNLIKRIEEMLLRAGKGKSKGKDGKQKF